MIVVPVSIRRRIVPVAGVPVARISHASFRPLELLTIEPQARVPTDRHEPCGETPPSERPYLATS